MSNEGIAQIDFAGRVKSLVEIDESVIGLAVGGSWITDDLDKYSDVDLILVTKDKLSDDKDKMLAFANRFGELLSAFTGEHVGEPLLLVCLYDNPLLHVDIKFLILDEFYERIEDPVILFDRYGSLNEKVSQSKAEFPYPDYQWIEDRFWIWIHYMLLKIGRGEYFEAFDSFSFLRNVVLGPLLHIKNGNLPRGVRNVEAQLKQEEAEALKSTIPFYNRQSLLDTLKNVIILYRDLRKSLFDDKVIFQNLTEQKVLAYFDEINNKA